MQRFPPSLACPECGGAMSRGAKLCHKCFTAAGGKGPLPAEGRNKHALCGAKKRNGETCRAYAGQGTDHKGYGSCKHHFGATDANGKAAFKQEVQLDLRQTYGVATEVPPAEALLLLNHISAGAVAWLGESIRSLPEEEVHHGHGAALIALYNSERDRLGKVAKACVDAGLEVKGADEPGGPGSIIDKYGRDKLLELLDLLKVAVEVDDDEWDAVVQNWLALVGHPSYTGTHAHFQRQTLLRERGSYAADESRRREREARQLGFMDLEKWRQEHGRESGREAMDAFLDEHGFNELFPYTWDKFVESERELRAAATTGD